MLDLIKSFIIGSSGFVTIPFYVAVINIPERTIKMDRYSIMVPAYFGLMNVLATIIRKNFNLSLWDSLVYVNIISIMIVWTVISITRPYHFKTQTRWIIQYLLIAIAHTISYLVIIYNLEKFFS